MEGTATGGELLICSGGAALTTRRPADTHLPIGVGPEHGAVDVAGILQRFGGEIERRRCDEEGIHLIPAGGAVGAHRSSNEMMS